MSFADADKLLVVARAHGVFQGYRVGEGIHDISLAWSSRSGRLVAVSSGLPMAVIRPNRDDKFLQLIDLLSGSVLQQLPNFASATFTPDGLSLLLHGPEMARPTMWQLSPLEKEDPTFHPFSVVSAGLRGRFVDGGPIQGPIRVCPSYKWRDPCGPHHAFFRAFTQIFRYPPTAY